jgi:hypothetical protein
MAEKTVSRKINITKDYRLFGRSSENRPLNIRKHKKLEQSLKEYGFLQCFPVVCYRDASGKLIVKDGQHRLAIAETLGMPVAWIEVDVDFDVAKINCAQEKWQLKDYAQKYAANGIKQYQEGMEFAEQYGITLGTAFALLAGTTTFSNIEAAYVTGKFQIKDRAWAEAVAFVFSRMVTISSALNKKAFVEACMAVTRVEDFDAKRLIHSAERCREKLVAYSNRDAFLDMLEAVYNFGRAKLVGLKALATMALRERSVTATAKFKKQAKQLEAVA